MKAFEKWRRKTVVGIGLNFQSGRSYKADARVWRAALEWYRDMMDEIEKHDIPLHGREIIEQELEE